MIGAGQAGLAMGYQLKKTGRSFLMVDGVAEVGDSWRLRYDTLTLFTTRDMSTLPGAPSTGTRRAT